MSFLAENWDSIMSILNALGLVLVAKQKNKKTF